MAKAHLKRDEPSAELLSPSLEALLKALKVCGDNQSELARRCGVKQPHVWKWIKAGGFRLSVFMLFLALQVAKFSPTNYALTFPKFSPLLVRYVLHKRLSQDRSL